MLKSVFIEGIQGSGKTTLAHRFQTENPRYHWYREGDYSPIELAWVTNQEFQQILARYPAIRGEICKKSMQEGERFIIPYTQILTEIPGFHKDLEQYEIYYMDGLVTHFEHRVRLEKKILKEVFQGKYHIIQRAVV